MGSSDSAVQSKVVDAKQASELQHQGSLLIDVREPNEYAQGHAPGSISLPLSQLERRISELSSNKDSSILLICKSGSRSTAAQKIFQRSGFTNTINVMGGINFWIRSGLPLIR